MKRTNTAGFELGIKNLVPRGLEKEGEEKTPFDNFTVYLSGCSSIVNWVMGRGGG